MLHFMRQCWPFHIGVSDTDDIDSKPVPATDPERMPGMPKYIQKLARRNEWNEQNAVLRPDFGQPDAAKAAEFTKSSKPCTTFAKTSASVTKTPASTKTCKTDWRSQEAEFRKKYAPPRGFRKSGHDHGMRAFFESMEHVNSMNMMVMQNLQYARMLEMTRISNLYAQNVYAGNLYTKSLHVYSTPQTGPSLIPSNRPPHPPSNPPSYPSQYDAVPLLQVVPSDDDRFLQIMRPGPSSDATSFGAECARCAQLLGGFSVTSSSVA